LNVTNTQVSDGPYGVWLQNAATGKFSKLSVSDTYLGFTSKSTSAVSVDKSTFKLNTYAVAHYASPLTMHASNVSDNYMGISIISSDANYPAQMNADGLILGQNEYGVVVHAGVTTSQVNIQNSNFAGN